MRQVDGTAKSVRGIGQGDKERLMLMPEAFGLDQRLAAWGVCVRPAVGQKLVSSQAAWAYLRGMLL
ncbi:MAG: hypothetical protein IPL59_00940 [Candidatus Competibacteraceae bacterium]|nr:hypothetical protein [Candidatus Competibacteraceae bacterium]